MGQKNEKSKFVLMAIVFLTLLIGLIVFITTMFIYQKGEINGEVILSIIIALIILVFAIYFIAKRKKEINQGIPQYDERSKKIMNLAAARAYYISLYWLLAIMWFDLVFQKFNLETNSVIGIGIGGMALIWMLCQLWYNKFGDKHL